MPLPLGEAGIRQVPNEPAVLSAMRASLGETHGLYVFPGMGSGPYAEKLAVNPAGIPMYNPPGMQALAPRMFIAEFLLELVESLLVVFLLAQTRLTSFGARLGFVLAAITTNISYWNWYGFPLAYTAAYMTTQLVAFLCVGPVAGAVMKPSPTAVAVETAP